MAKINLSALNLFITSRCNSRCEKCFYKSSLNKRDDLNFSEIEVLSKSLGRVRTLNISGGEPFLRTDLPEILDLFIKNNDLKSISIPTNGLLLERIKSQTEKILKIAKGRKIVVCLSLDGTEKIHDKIRGIKGSFKKTIKTCQGLIRLKKRYPNLSIRIATTVYKENYNNLFDLYFQVSKSVPEIDFLSLNIGRPSSFGASFDLPTNEQFKKLFLYKQKVLNKKRAFLLSFCEKMIFLVALERLKEKKQIIPCLAGQKEGVVFANGEVKLCELLPSLGNIKNESFQKIWKSEKAKAQREKIINEKCYCTHEGFLYYSLLNRPLSWPRLAFKSLTLR